MDEHATVLVIEDEAPIRRFLRAGLTAAHYQVIEAESVSEGLRQAATRSSDLVLLDLGLPDGDGIEVVQRIREWSEIPIIVLSARGLEASKVEALDLGANDYVTKPFGMPELLARVRAALRLRRGAETEQSTIEVGELRIDFAAHQVLVAGAEVRLTPLEFKLLGELAQNVGKVMTHRQLLLAVWGPAYARETQYLRVFMGNLRRKLERDPTRPQHLVTESGVGYRFQE